ncbi:MAG TPA: hypothetical protein VI278_07640 [Nitrososphaeraceae archaeon]
MSNHIEDSNHDLNHSLLRKQQQQGEEPLLHPHHIGVTIRNTLLREFQK